MAENTENAAKNVSSSATNFTTDFHKKVAGSIEGNFVSSALSAHVVLSMTAYGADGNTAKEMKKTLHLSDNDEIVHQGFQSFINALNNVENVILIVANKVYASKKINIKNKFREITASYFHSESEVLDFSKSKEAANAVNDWCVKKTNGKIESIISEGDVSDDTRLVLLNAVYFKGNWKHKFPAENTKMKPFYVNKTTTVEVPTMHLEKKFFYKPLEELNAECVGLPYQNEDLLMVLIIPKEIDGLKEIEKNLEKLKFDYEKEFRLYKRDVQLALPKFKVETKMLLNTHLTELGMAEMFSNHANFSGIADESLKVDKVLQKAFIEVNEEGSEAAAVTAVTVMMCCAPEQPILLKVDRPFLYKIVNCKNNIILFSGRVSQPMYAC